MEAVEQNPSGMILVAFDRESAESIVGVTRREVPAVVLDGGQAWTVSYASPLDRFEEMHPVFELSMLTLKWSPDWEKFTISMS